MGAATLCVIFLGQGAGAATGFEGSLVAAPPLLLLRNGATMGQHFNQTLLGPLEIIGGPLCAPLAPSLVLRVHLAVGGA